MADLPVFVIGVNRSDGTSDFSKREIAQLERVHPFLDCAVTRLHEHEAARNLIDSIAIAARGGARLRDSGRPPPTLQASQTARRMRGVVRRSRGGDARSK